MNPTRKQLGFIVSVGASVGLVGENLDQWVKRFGIEGLWAIPDRNTASKIIGALLRIQGARIGKVGD